MPVLSAGATDDNQNLAIDDTTITETQIEELYKRLCLIHDTLDFHPHKRELKREIPEQLMALKFLDTEAVVLEATRVAAAASASTKQTGSDDAFAFKSNNDNTENGNSSSTGDGGSSKANDRAST